MKKLFNARQILFKTVALVIGISLAVIITELLLRIIQPAIVQLNIEKLIHPDFERKNERIIENLKGTNFYNAKLDSVIFRTVNNLGFRGPDLPDDNSNLYKIIAVGGSTTICHYLSDRYDWPTIVGKNLMNADSSVWMNNAGLDGHSTFGHLAVLPEIILPLRPQMILFLVGCNDVELSALREFDNSKPQQDISLPKPEFNISFYHRFYLYRLYFNSTYIYRLKKITRNNRVWHQNIDFSKQELLDTDESLKSKKIQIQIQQFIPDYKKRLMKLIELCKANNAAPVFITQPTILGNGVDIATGVDMGKIPYSDNLNGDIYWNMLQLYNQALKEVCIETNCYYIDLAKAMPKNSAYYYDYFHFTNKGAALAAEIILKELPAAINKQRDENISDSRL